MLAPRGPRQSPGTGRAAGASCIPGRGGWCRVTPPRGWQAGKGGSQSPCAAASAAVASFLQLMLFWAKLEANGSWGGELEPAAPPAAVRSPRSSRWSAEPRAHAASRHGRPRARTRPHTPRAPLLWDWATAKGPNPGMCQPPHGHGNAWGFSPSGLQGTPPSSPARWPPQCCLRRRRRLRPAGTPAPSPSQPLQEPGVPISAHPHAKRAAQLWFCALHHPGRELVGRCWAGSGSCHFLALVGRGGEGAMTLLCSWTRSVSSRRKSLVAGPVI